MTPTSPALSRRGLLLAGAGAALLAACGRGGGPGSASSSLPTTATTGAVSGAGEVNLLLGSFQPLALPDQRLAFGVLRGAAPLPAGAEVAIALAPPGGDFGEPVAAVRRSDGLDERPLHVVQADLGQVGTWRAVAVVGDERSREAAVPVVDPATSKVPVPGGKVPSVPTPTVADPMGVDPLCTRQPACPLHDVSLDRALGEGRPVALLFSTPALCQSAVCGPVLDSLLAHRDRFAGRVRFVHVEIYTDTTGETTTAPVKAFELVNEPFLFLLGPDGVVRTRFDGPYTADEVEAALAELAG